MTTINLISWNVNGARAIYKAGFMDWLAAGAADIVCLQETRADAEQLPADLRQPDGYQAYWNASSARKGYSGTAILTRMAPLSVRYGLDVPEFDTEGRTLIAEYPWFTLINCYFPNGSRDHSRVPFKLAFYDAFLAECERLRRAGRPVIFCGDVNTAHQPIDLARPRQNENTTGFLREERDWLDQLVSLGYVDTFRQLYPDLAGQYTWWSQIMQARAKNIGWRIDYFFMTPELIPCLRDAYIWPDVRGSDHCPVGIRLEVA